MRSLFSRWKKNAAPAQPAQQAEQPVEQKVEPGESEAPETSFTPAPQPAYPAAEQTTPLHHHQAAAEPEPPPHPVGTGAPTKEETQGFFRRLVRGLAKTRSRITQVLTGRSSIDADLYTDLEEALIQADVGISTATHLVDAVKKRVNQEHVTNPQEVAGILRAEMVKVLEEPAQPLTTPTAGQLTVFLVVGVNGAGKTTTIGKLAARYQRAGLRVILGAADTFRAAAIEQLEEWGKRAGVDVVKHQEGSDPASVAFDAVQAAKARRADVLIIDTAGRLQTKQHLMQELSKINRVVERELGRKPDEVLLVMDATTGQNGLSQARVFSEATPVTGVALTKLDGTARGGIVLAVAADMHLPVKLIGIGEGIDDLRDFAPAAFAAALFEAEPAG